MESESVSGQLPERGAYTRASTERTVLGILRDLRAVCTCSNSQTSGLGAHEPDCLGERANRVLPAVDPIGELCTACVMTMEVSDVGGWRHGRNGWLCANCWRAYESNEAFGSWMRQLLAKASMLPSFKSLTSSEMLALIKRRAAALGVTRAD